MMNKQRQESIKKALKKHFVNTIIITLLSIICWYTLELYSMQKGYISDAIKKQDLFWTMYINTVLSVNNNEKSINIVESNITSLNNNYVVLSNKIDEVKDIAIKNAAILRNTAILGSLSYNTQNDDELKR